MSDDEASYQKQTAPRGGVAAAVGTAAKSSKNRNVKKAPLSHKNLAAHKSDLDKRGVVYMSRIPPKMKANKIKTLLEKEGAEILRVYLAAEDGSAAARRREAGGKRGKRFTEGWIEFASKKVAKRLAANLNGQNMGGKHFSTHHYDLWNLKYLSKFKWDNLSEELAYQKAIKEQKLQQELRNAKRERDFYLEKVDQKIAVEAMEARNAKKREAAGEAEGDSAEEGEPKSSKKSKVHRSFYQRGSIPDPSADDAETLDMSLLANVFSRK